MSTTTSARLAPRTTARPCTIIMSRVTGTVTDRAGNTATTSAAITLTMQSVQFKKNQMLIQMGQELNGATFIDKLYLKVARGLLALSLDSRLWNNCVHANWNSCNSSTWSSSIPAVLFAKIKHLTGCTVNQSSGCTPGDGNHVSAFGGVIVFQLEKLSVGVLELFKTMNSSQVPDSVIQGWIDGQAAADRTLAQVAINDAIAANGNASKIAQAQAALAAGDAEDAGGDEWDAIDDFTAAWIYAQQAVGCNPLPGSWSV